MTRASAPLSGNDRRAEPGTHQITTKDPGVTPRRAEVPDYQCNATGTAWTFLHPEATLTAEDGTPIIHHFAGPTWQSLDDGSSVQGTTIASRPSPSGAIPWLLLAAKNNTLGPQGGDMLFPITYIQRVHTTGGVAPATPCTPGVVQAVPYTADYIFYEAENSQN